MCFSSLGGIVATAGSNDTTWLIANIYVYVGSTKVTGDIKIELPKYIIINQKYLVNYEFRRSACGYAPATIINLAGEVTDPSGGKRQYDLASFHISFNCNDQGFQRGSLEIVVPEPIYQLSDGKIKFFVKIVSNGKLENQVPATVYLVRGVPEPRLQIRGITNGYAALEANSSLNIYIDVTARNAPLVITDVVAQAPNFVTVYVNTPIPLTIGANQTYSFNSTCGRRRGIHG